MHIKKYKKTQMHTKSTSYLEGEHVNEKKSGGKDEDDIHKGYLI